MDFWITQILKLLRQSAFLKLSWPPCCLVSQIPGHIPQMPCAAPNAQQQRKCVSIVNTQTILVCRFSLVQLYFQHLMHFCQSLLVSSVQIRNSLVQQVLRKEKLHFHSTHSYCPLKIKIVVIIWAPTYMNSVQMISKVVLRILWCMSTWPPNIARLVIQPKIEQPTQLFVSPCSHPLKRSNIFFHSSIILNLMSSVYSFQQL